MYSTIDIRHSGTTTADEFVALFEAAFGSGNTLDIREGLLESRIFWNDADKFLAPAVYAYRPTI